MAGNNISCSKSMLIFCHFVRLHVLFLIMWFFHLYQIDKLQSSFHQWERISSDSGERIQQTKELLASCESIEWQVNSQFLNHVVCFFYLLWNFFFFLFDFYFIKKIGHHLFWGFNVWLSIVHDSICVFSESLLSW